MQIICDKFYLLATKKFICIIKFKTISIPIGDGEQEFRITGIGEKAIKIEKYVKYEDMMDAVMDGKDEGLEAIIMEFIEDFE